MTKTTKPKPNRHARACRICGLYWTPEGMPCYNCLGPILDGYQREAAIAETTRQAAQPKAHKPCYYR